MSETIKKQAPVLRVEDFIGKLPMPEQMIEQQSEEINLNNVFIPNWNNRPIQRPAIITLADTPILSYQNTTAVIAHPGTGKSSLCEAMVSSYLNKDVDNLGFDVNQSCEGVIYIDNERTNTDVWNSFYRICRRTKIGENEELKNVTIAGLRSVPRLAERLKTIEHLLKTNPCSLLLLDGAGDLVTDTNDLMQAIDCRIWLREITVNYKVSIFTTLHPNPGSFKPRGHIGSEIWRESECVLLAKAIEGDVRVITSDFEHGKNRNNPKLTSGYKWSDTHQMFISAEAENFSRDNRKLIKILQLLDDVLGPLDSLTRTELEKKIMKVEGVKDSSADRRVRDFISNNLIQKGEDGRYRRINKSVNSSETI